MKSSAPPAPPARRGRLDLLTLPVLGRLLRWRHARSTLQTLLLAVGVLVIVDGFLGPSIAPRNAAGALPWVHWRGFVAVALLVVGNAFCFACPFMLPRRLAKRLFPALRDWPRRLRTKWLAAILLILWFWFYEAFDLWSSPWLTAWVAVGYFVAAFVVDAVFRGATFCKHLCPIGHFHFVNSLVSPFEVKIREAQVCADCDTKDCITGLYEGRVRTPLVQLGAGGSAGSMAGEAEAGEMPAAPRTPGSWGSPTQNGCELWLFQEQKVGNMDCTFCLDCVHACPHDNVGVLSRTPGSELWDDRRRSALGRFSRRPDLAALAVVLTFGALVNAFGMIAPVYAVEAWIASILGTRSEPLVLGILFVAGFVVIPALAVGGAAWCTRLLAGGRESVRSLATKYSYSLVPVGFGVWIAHYLYHFLLGGLAIVPVAQSRLSELGIGMLGSPRWSWSGLLGVGWIQLLEVALVEAGMLLSLVVAYKIASREHGDGRLAIRAFLPWAILVLGLSLAGLWILLQPMEMRGITL